MYVNLCAGNVRLNSSSSFGNINKSFITLHKSCVYLWIPKTHIMSRHARTQNIIKGFAALARFMLGRQYFKSPLLNLWKITTISRIYAHKKPNIYKEGERRRQEFIVYFLFTRIFIHIISFANDIQNVCSVWVVHHHQNL